MNKKNINIILILALTLIWSAVIYKFFFKRDTSNELLLDNSMNLNFKENPYVIKKNDFKLKLTNTNPFKSTKKTKLKQGKKTSRPKPIAKQKELQSWPKIEYYGFVKANNHKTKLVLIKVNGKIYRTRENEIINYLKIKKAYSDSIQIALGNQVKTYIKY